MERKSIICNKCFAPMYRGKRPYHITQCGHISCRTCLEQVEKLCPQCQRAGTMSIAMEEPLVPKLIPYFQSLPETLEMLLKVVTFRSNQEKITMQRFIELDKKYEILKNRYWLGQRNMKELMKKYAHLKNEVNELDKKMLLSRMQKETPRSTYHLMKTPVSDSGISMQIPSSRCTEESLESTNKTFRHLTDSRSQYKTADGFLMPVNYKLPKSNIPQQNMF
ncbi:hypothetical protein PUN28_000699 [Cardiocondyla obscurior]|uniref:RING-type domain-containing protein n=1 Tax=Cardiocondyla obscurior TaxID=286306 RepID=A0AAW2H0S8_9HYME